MPQEPNRTSYLSRHRTICAVLEELREMGGYIKDAEMFHYHNKLINEAKDYAQRMSARLMEYKRAETVGVVTQELVADLVRESERAMKQRDEAIADPSKRGHDGRTHDTTFEHILRQHLDPTYSFYKAK